MSGRRRGSGPFPWRVHPIWRGIGFLLLILIPIISYGLAELLLDWFTLRNPNFTRMLAANPSFLSNPLFIKGAMTLVISIAIYLAFSTVSSLFYSLLGGRRDEEIAEHTPKRYR